MGDDDYENKKIIILLALNNLTLYTIIQDI
jgi:hypothetical protein